MCTVPRGLSQARGVHCTDQHSIQDIEHRNVAKKNGTSSEKPNEKEKIIFHWCITLEQDIILNEQMEEAKVDENGSGDNEEIRSMQGKE